MHRSWVLAAAVLGSTLAFVDQSVANVALPRIEAGLGTTLLAMQWVVNAYMLCMSALLLVGGAAGDQFGRRRVFIIGVTLFAGASVACGLAPSASALVAARAAQGIGAALLVPCSLALIGASFDVGERGAAIGIWSGASALAAGLAPLLGGYLVDHVSWRAIFLINPALAVPTLWIAVTKVPESRDSDAPSGVDWRGASLALAALGCLVYALIGSNGVGRQPRVSMLFWAAGVLLLVGFALAERCSRSPMMPLELFRSRTFSGINLLTLLLYGALGGAFFFLPFLLIEAHGWSATAAGTAYVPFTLVLAALSRWSGGLLDRYGARRPLVVGPILVALGFTALCAAGRSYWATLGAMALIGFGMAIAVAPLTATVLNTVPTNRAGVASGINNAVASLGSLLTIALLGSLAVGIFDRSLERELATANAPQPVTEAVRAARGAFAVPSPSARLSASDRASVHSTVVSALEETVRKMLWSAAALAFASAAVAALTVQSESPQRHRGGSPLR